MLNSVYLIEVNLCVRWLYMILQSPSDCYYCLLCLFRCLAVSPNFEIAKNNMAIALTDLGTKVN